LLGVGRRRGLLLRCHGRVLAGIGIGNGQGWIAAQTTANREGGQNRYQDRQ